MSVGWRRRVWMSLGLGLVGIVLAGAQGSAVAASSGAGEPPTADADPSPTAASEGLPSSVAPSPASLACDGVTARIQAQAEAWNRGDLPAFTAIYDERAAFVSPSGLTHGRQQVLERYLKRYPDRAAMGTLSLEVLECRAFSGAGEVADNADGNGVPGVSVVGRWHLSYPDDAERQDAEGLTLLVFERQGEAWMIVHDASM